MSVRQLYRAIKDIGRDIDTEGALKEVHISDLESTLGDLGKSTEDVTVESLLGALKELPMLLEACAGSLKSQQAATKEIVKQTRQQSHDYLMRCVAVVRVENANAIHTLQTQISDLEDEREKLLEALGMGTESNYDPATDDLDEALEAAVEIQMNDTENQLDNIEINLENHNSNVNNKKLLSPVHEEGEDGDDKSSVSRVSRGTAHTAMTGWTGIGTGNRAKRTNIIIEKQRKLDATVAECLRLHEEVKRCQERINILELSEKSLQDDLKIAQSTIESKDAAIESLNKVITAGEKLSEDTKEKNEANLRRLSNESIAQKAYFREMMNKFRSQVQVEMAKQQQSALERIQKEREAVVTASTLDQERAIEVMKASHNHRFNEIVKRHRSELASCRHMHKQELERILTENHRMKRLLYQKTGENYNVSLASSMNGKMDLTAGRPSSPSFRNELPWGMGGPPKDHLGIDDDMDGHKHSLSNHAKLFTGQLNRLLTAMNDDDIDLNTKINNAIHSVDCEENDEKMNINGASHECSSPSSSISSHVPPLPSSTRSTSMTSFSNSKNFQNSQSQYHHHGQSDGDEGYFNKFLRKKTKVHFSETVMGGSPQKVTERAEVSAKWAGEDAERRHRIARKTDEEAELENELAKLSHKQKIIGGSGSISNSHDNSGTDAIGAFGNPSDSTSGSIGKETVNQRQNKEEDDSRNKSKNSNIFTLEELAKGKEEDECKEMFDINKIDEGNKIGNSNCNTNEQDKQEINNNRFESSFEEALSISMDDK